MTAFSNSDTGGNPFDMLNVAGWQGILGPNPYLPNPDKALSMPGYYGTPTDATGKPIQSFLDAQNQAARQPAPAPTPGTTLNSLGPNQPWNAGSPAYWAQQVDAAPVGGPGGFGSQATESIQGQQLRNDLTNLMGSQQAWQNAAKPQQAAPTPPPGIDMRQAYLNALSNPGPVTTPGVVAPQSPTPGTTPSVLQNFLAQNKGGMGAGNYSNKGFFGTLNRMQGQQGGVG